VSERTAKHDTTVVERKFKSSPAGVFAAWKDPDAYRAMELSRRRLGECFLLSPANPETSFSLRMSYITRRE
jgi:hypothetical protein